MAETISAEQVEKIARLAHLDLTADERDLMQRDLGAVLEHIRQLEAVDVSGVEPTTHTAHLQGPARKDEPSDSLPLDTVLRAAPERIGDGFGVPKIIE